MKGGGEEGDEGRWGGERMEGGRRGDEGRWGGEGMKGGGEERG